MIDHLTDVIHNWLTNTFDPYDDARVQAENLADTIESLNADDAKVRAEAWDECLDEIEEHELNTEQAREGNPYRTKEGDR